MPSRSSQGVRWLMGSEGCSVEKDLVDLRNHINLGKQIDLVHIARWKIIIIRLKHTHTQTSPNSGCRDILLDDDDELINQEQIKWAKSVFLSSVVFKILSLLSKLNDFPPFFLELQTALKHPVATIFRHKEIDRPGYDFTERILLLKTRKKSPPPSFSPPMRAPVLA